MKKLLPVLVLVWCCVFKAKAQTYVPFPDSGVVFTNTFYQANQQMNYPLLGVEHIFLNGEDTLINGMNYTIIRSDVYPYRGALRSDTGKVYIVPPDSSSEMLLYDFTISSMTTINCVYNSVQAGGNSGGCEGGFSAYPGSATSGLDSTIVVNGLTRRIIYTSGTEWIEGIGNIHGFLCFSDNYTNSMIFALSCMIHNGIVLWTENWPSMGLPFCDLTFGKEDELIAKELNVFPNPAKECIKVNGIQNAERAMCTLRDLMGKTIVAEVKTDGGILSLDVRNIPAGMYLLRIENDSRFVVKKVLIEK